MTALLEVFYRPAGVFAALPQRKNAWVLPLACNVFLLFLVGVLVPHFIGRENLMRRQLEGHPEIGAAQKMRTIAGAGAPAHVIGGYVATVFFALLLHAALAGALTILAMMTPSPPAWGTMLAMVALALFPGSLIFTVLTLQTLLTAANPGALDAARLVPTNLAYYIDQHSVTWGVYSLFGSLDILSFAEIGLLALGFSKVTRTGILLGLAAAGGLWIFYISVIAISVLL